MNKKAFEETWVCIACHERFWGSGAILESFKPFSLLALQFCNSSLHVALHFVFCKRRKQSVARTSYSLMALILYFMLISARFAETISLGLLQGVSSSIVRHFSILFWPMTREDFFFLLPASMEMGTRNLTGDNFSWTWDPSPDLLAATPCGKVVFASSQTKRSWWGSSSCWLSFSQAITLLLKGTHTQMW